MTFKLSKESRDFFKKLNKNADYGRFPIEWDWYYLCLLIGLTEKKMAAEEKLKDAEEIIRDFPKIYKDSKFEIIAALIAAELERKGRDIKETREEELIEIIKKFFSDSPNELQPIAYELLNRYAEHGYQRIVQEFKQPLKEPDMFLYKYYEKFLKSI